MSENTIFSIEERVDGLFDVSRYWAEDDSPELEIYRREGLTLREATAYCDSEHAEYGYHIVWLEKEVQHGED